MIMMSMHLYSLYNPFVHTDHNSALKTSLVVIKQILTVMKSISQVGPNIRAMLN